jgi:dystonin
LIQEKKSDFDNLNKSGLALAKLCNKTIDGQVSDGNGVVKDSPSAIHLKKLIESSNSRYDLFKKLVKKKKDELEGLLWKSAEFSERLDNLANNLIIAEETVEYAEPISAHPDKIRQKLEENQMIILDLEKRHNALEDLKAQAQSMSNASLENLASVNHIDNANEILEEIDP